MYSFFTQKPLHTDCRGRDEDPVGKWTLKVSDQSNHEKGSFLGWSMTMWGSAVDASLAEKFELPDDPDAEHHLPSLVSPTGVSNHHPKPTSHLPDDHGEQPGEATRPAFQTGVPTTIPDAAQKGFFTNMYKLVSKQLWIIGAFGVVVIGAAAGIFLYLRRRTARIAGGSYAPIPGGDIMTMRTLAEHGGPVLSGSGVPGAEERAAGGARELYEAFGIGSDEEDADERSPLTGGAGRFRQAAAPLTYHDGFLDDDGMTTARTSGTPYRDASERADAIVASVAHSTDAPP